LKKRTKKLFPVWAEPIRNSRSRNIQKFFASFFQKKDLASACLAQANNRPDLATAVSMSTSVLTMNRRGVTDDAGCRIETSPEDY
jgi:hypothetical protein